MANTLEKNSVLMRVGDGTRSHGDKGYLKKLYTY